MSGPFDRRVTRAGGLLLADERGVSAVEFALVLPLFLLIIFGGYQISQALSAYRKVTLTARTVADLATQYTTMAASDVSTVLNASTQVMAPFNASNLSIVMTEYATSAAGVSTVTWSKALNATPLTAGAVTVLSSSICRPNTSVVLAQVTYNFKPAVAYRLTGTIPMSSAIFMAPRSVSSIPYTGS